jgi:hypothetical protein
MLKSEFFIKTLLPTRCMEKRKIYLKMDQKYGFFVPQFRLA